MVRKNINEFALTPNCPASWHFTGSAALLYLRYRSQSQHLMPDSTRIKVRPACGAPRKSETGIKIVFKIPNATIVPPIFLSCTRLEIYLIKLGNDLTTG
jgi:hypothetical protein